VEEVFMYDKIKYYIAGDKALGLEFGNCISEKINEKIRAMTIAIETKHIHGIVEIVPTYRSLLVHYNPLIIEYSFRKCCSCRCKTRK